MITFSKLGNYGRLGNQLFQYAFLFGLSKLKGYNFCIPKNTDLENCFNLKCEIKNLYLNKTIHEKYFQFDVSYPKDYTDDTDYHGYFQTEKYFSKYKNELIKSLEFKDIHKKEIPEKNLISIHIRRGDYVENSYHPVVSLEYINKAKTFFPQKKFMVFSDDIEWCKQNNIGDYYSENNSHYTDLYLMTMCSSSIIANSSFSWWGAYLSPKEKIIAPIKWFMNMNHKLTDLYCKNWIQI